MFFIFFYLNKQGKWLFWLFIASRWGKDVHSTLGINNPFLWNRITNPILFLCCHESLTIPFLFHSYLELVH